MSIKLSFLSLGLALCLGACSSSTPEPEAPAEGSSTDGASEPEPPAEGGLSAGGDCAELAPWSPERCECEGGFVRGDIGDGKVKCEDDETDLGRVNQGIEGAVCCKKS